MEDYGRLNNNKEREEVTVECSYNKKTSIKECEFNKIRPVGMDRGREGGLGEYIYYLVHLLASWLAGVN